MGTPSMIGICNEDGTVTATYCHYDGYLEGNGRTLVQLYNTPESARAVAEVGYLSGLSDNLELDIRESVHTARPVRYESVEDYMLSGGVYAGSQYLYLFDGEAWFFINRYSEETRFEEVEMNLN